MATWISKIKLVSASLYFFLVVQVGQRITFVPNHEASVEGAIYSVHAKLPKLSPSRCPRFRIPPVKVRYNHESAGPMMKDYLHQNVVFRVSNELQRILCENSD